MHFCGIGSRGAVDIPTFVGSVFLKPAVVGCVGIDLAAAQWIVLGTDGVLKPHGLVSATDTNHGKRAVSATQ